MNLYRVTLHGMFMPCLEYGGLHSLVMLAWGNTKEEAIDNIKNNYPINTPLDLDSFFDTIEIVEPSSLPIFYEVVGKGEIEKNK